MTNHALIGYLEYLGVRRVRYVLFDTSRATHVAVDEVVGRTGILDPSGLGRATLHYFPDPYDDAGAHLREDTPVSYAEFEIDVDNRTITRLNPRHTERTLDAL